MKAHDATMNQYFAIHKVTTEAANVIAISSVAHWFTSSPYVAGATYDIEPEVRDDVDAALHEMMEDETA